ncbi:MAG: hypothetical protein AAFV53_32020 [Myxococcota bacterium]
MRYAFSPDGTHLAWLDAHGLLRLTVGGRQKRVDVAGGLLSSLSISASGERLLVQGSDGYPKPSWRYRFPEMTEVERYERNDRRLHPDGEHTVYCHTHYAQPQIRLAVSGAGGSTTEPYPQTGAVDQGTWALGARPDLPDRSTFAFELAPDGSFLILDRNHRLFGGILSDPQQPATITFTATVVTALGTTIRLYPDRERSMVVMFDGRTQTNHVVVFPAQGAPARFSVAGFAPLQRAGDVLAVQRDAQTVVRLSLPAALAGPVEEERFPLPGTAWTVDGATLSPANHLAFAHAVVTGDLWDTGRGDVLLHERALWFVPWHGEALLNLQTGERVARTLPGTPDQISARRCLAARFTRLREQGDAYGCPNTLSSLRIRHAYGHNGYSSLIARGDVAGDLSAHLIAATLSEVSDEKDTNDLHGWRRSSTGWTGGDISVRAYTLAGAEAMLRMVVTERIPLRNVLQILKEYIGHLGSRNDHEENPGPMPLEVEQVLLWAAMEGYRRPDIDVLAAIPTWRSAPITEDFIDEHLHEVISACQHTGQTGAFHDALRHYFERQGESVYLPI